MVGLALEPVGDACPDWRVLTSQDRLVSQLERPFRASGIETESHRPRCGTSHLARTDDEDVSAGVGEDEMIRPVVVPRVEKPCGAASRAV